MIIRRSNNSALHCESGLPAVDLPGLKQWYIDGKLHRSDGPAVVPLVGKSMFFWRGIYISGKLWKECESYSSDEILGIDNLELRRAILEKVGYAKFLDTATLLDEGVGDFAGCKLHTFHSPTEEPPDDRVVFAQLKNSTPEPDGEYKYYFLRVPPNMETVSAAVKWSFGFSKGQKMSYLAQS